MFSEKDQNPTAKIARIICYIVMATVTIGVLLLYGIYFDDLSETELVQISFVWVSLMGFGIGGLLLAYKGVGAAMGIGLVIAMAFFLALQTFYSVVWPSL
jgi:FtsH-binding integral membrane protein